MQTPAGIQTLLIANVLGFLIGLGGSESLVQNLALWPLHAGFMPWQLVSYAFLHVSIAHLAFNMLGLWMFGRELEYLMGRKGMLQLYFASVLSAAIAQLVVTSLAGSAHPTVGASGGVFGVLLAYAVLFPKRIVVLLFPPIPLPVWLFATLYASVELALGVSGTQAGVAHFAHLGGMIGGYLALGYWRRQSRRQR